MQAGPDQGPYAPKRDAKGWQRSKDNDRPAGESKGEKQHAPNTGNNIGNNTST
jgi:hypothetical protein